MPLQDFWSRLLNFGRSLPDKLILSLAFQYSKNKHVCSLAHCG